MAGFYRHANDSAAARFDDVAPDDSVGSPVGAFCEDVGLQSLDQIVRSGLVEDHHTIHACQRFEDLGALGLGGNGTSRSLDLPDERSEFKPTIKASPSARACWRYRR
jgi:hypothetical protein